MLLVQAMSSGIDLTWQDARATFYGDASGADTMLGRSLIHCWIIFFLSISPTPAKYAPQSQSFNFLSSSAGCNGLKVDDCLIKGGNRLGPFSKSQVPYFRSIQQQHGLMAIPTTSNQYTSTSYLDQPPTAGPQVRLQQPHYYGTPLCGTHYSSTNSYKQQYQNIWAAQLVTQDDFNLLPSISITEQQHHRFHQTVTPSADSDSDSDGPQEYYTGGEKSGMLVQDPSKGNDVDAIFNQARQLGAVERPLDQLQEPPRSTSFAGTGRLLSGETVQNASNSQQPESVVHNIVFWSSGFTVNNGPLRRLDDLANASFLESIKKSECPKELEPADRRSAVNVNLIRRNENYREPERAQVSFQG
ncbi:hypothetical protein RYX36_000152, partial [Vicia faba]